MAFSNSITACISFSLSKFKPFNLQDFPDEVTVLPREVEKQINDKITNTLK